MQTYRARKLLALIIVLACGALVLLLLSAYLKQRENQFKEELNKILRQNQPAMPPEMMLVLLASRDILPQFPIAPDDLSVKQIPAEYVQPQAVTSLNEVIGQISTVPIASGEQILKNKLLPPVKIGKSLSEITPEGKRAVNVSLDDSSGIVNLIQPGDYVDVLVLITAPGAAAVWPSAEKPSPRLVPLFQGVKVLAAGGEFVTTDAGQTATKGEVRGASLAERTVTLALTPQESSLFTFAQEQGKIKLSLRSAQDTKKEAIKPEDWDSLLKYLYSDKEPDEEGEEGRPSVVEIYRGLKKETLAVSEKEKLTQPAPSGLGIYTGKEGRTE